MSSNSATVSPGESGSCEQAILTLSIEQLKENFSEYIEEIYTVESNNDDPDEANHIIRIIAVNKPKRERIKSKLHELNIPVYVDVVVNE
jgi:hypothetical protein